MDRKQTAIQAFGLVEEELRSFSKWMYENPELGHQEVESSRRCADFLRAHAFEVTYPAYGLETAFEATIGSGDPRVVICAEYDALPGVGHACGHNIIATAGLGAGVALAGLADELGVRVTVLGTPAEEGAGGKVDLIRAGAFQDASAAMMVHPAPEDVLDPAFLAVRHINVEFFGKESHASFAPQLGVNALDAFVQAYVAVSTLRQALYPTDKVHGIITHGGEAPNVIPSYTRSSWYVRASTSPRLEELAQKVEACFHAAGRATGCRVEISVEGNPYDDMVNNPVLVEIFATNAAALGRRMGLQADRDPAATGSTDMGNVSHVLPSIHPMLSIDPGDAVNHQPEFAAHTITPPGEKAIRDGALAMAHTIIDMAEQAVWDRL